MRWRLQAGLRRRCPMRRGAGDRVGGAFPHSHRGRRKRDPPRRHSRHPEEQVELAARTGESLLPILIREDNQVVITHGNGPVVGKILMRQTLARDRVAPMSLDICVAHSQGASPTC